MAISPKDLNSILNIYSLFKHMEVNKMPNKDETGPKGKGAKTGRQEGKCEGAKPIERGLGSGSRARRRGLGRQVDNPSSN